MTLAETPGAAACPACVATELVRPDQPQESGPATIQLSLPTIHCAACISAVERKLGETPGVISARVNLTLKRARIEAERDVEAADLAEILEGIGYEAHELDADALGDSSADSVGRDLLMRLAVAGFAQMNVMILSVAVWSGAEDATRDLFHWISGTIAVPAAIFAGRPFYVSAWSALRNWRLNMDVPISLAILLALGISIWETALSGRHAYFDAAVSLTFFLLLGRYLDHRTRSMARSAAKTLAALEVPRATLVGPDGTERIVRVESLCPGDVVRVKPGARIPVDGEVVEGASEIDRSFMTGESLPARAVAGDVAHAGEINLTGPLTLRVTAAGANTALSRIAGLVAVAEAGRENYNSLADRAARAYAPVVHLLALAAFAAWMWITHGDVRHSLNIAVAVLIITCPCALGLAVPAVTAAASGRLFRHGFLIKSGTALERLAEADTVVFDKTGTLTIGAPEPRDLDRFDDDALSHALALAQGSSHPLAAALARQIVARGVRSAAVEDVHEVPGHGIEGRVAGRIIRLGRADWVGADALDETATYLSVPGRPTVAFAFEDRIRPGASEAIAALRERGLKVELLSGDTEAPVAALAGKLGIETHRSGATPSEKAEYLARLSSEGRKVLMMGDGLNDTAALAGAHVSISPASALDAARTASDIVLTGVSLEKLPLAFETAHASRKRISENFAISGLYNIVAVPFALIGLATPLAAALAMSLSSITVSLNAMRLR